MVNLQSVQEPAWQAMGMRIRTKNALEMQPETAQIGPLWQRYFQAGGTNQIPQCPTPQRAYGIYTNYESDFEGNYDLIVGSGAVSGIDCPAGFVSFAVPAAKRLVFHNKGALPQAVQDTWQHIWQYFAEQSEIKRAYTTDYEVYDLADEGRIEIHIAVL